MILFSGDDRAVSFVDETSPDSRVTGGKICINGQVNRDRSLDWYYKIIQFFPDVRGELKSRGVAERFRSFPAGVRNSIWVGLARVKIHIVDPRFHRHKINNILRRAWKNEHAPKLLDKLAREGLTNALRLSLQLRDMVADSILQDSTAVRVQYLGRVHLDPFGIIKPDELGPYFVRSATPSRPLISTGDFRKSRSVIRDAASWASKASAVFHAALDAGQFPDDDSAMSYRSDLGSLLRRRMAQHLLPVHAFDEGNRGHLDLLDDTRNILFEELAAHDTVYGLMPTPAIVPVESSESFYVQAADIAAGIASDLYASEGLIGVVQRFEYVTYNGVRISCSDAEEEMRKLRIIET